jgi:hypothetical protein
VRPVCQRITLVIRVTVEYIRVTKIE